MPAIKVNSNKKITWQLDPSANPSKLSPTSAKGAFVRFVWSLRNSKNTEGWRLRHSPQSEEPATRWAQDDHGVLWQLRIPRWSRGIPHQYEPIRRARWGGGRERLCGWTKPLLAFWWFVFWGVLTDRPFRDYEWLLLFCSRLLTQILEKSGCCGYLSWFVLHGVAEFIHFATIL